MDNEVINPEPEPTAPDPIPVVPTKSHTGIIILSVIVFLLVCGTGYLFYQNQQLVKMISGIQIVTPAPTVAAPTPTPMVDPFANWKTYTSKTEKITFKYPSDWTSVKPTMQSNHPTADQISLQSPTGIVKIAWISAVDGFGGGCDETATLSSGEGCPQFTLIEKTPAIGANGLFLVSGTVTRDGKVFEPYMAIQDSRGVTKTGRMMIYNLFQGRNNQSEMENNITTTAIFSLSGSFADKKMGEKEATSFFMNPEVILAKQILQSLTY